MNISPKITKEILKLATIYSKTSEISSLPPREFSNYHPPITKHPAKQEIRNFT